MAILAFILVLLIVGIVYYGLAKIAIIGFLVAAALTLLTFLVSVVHELRRRSRMEASLETYKRNAMMPVLAARPERAAQQENLAASDAPLEPPQPASNVSDDELKELRKIAGLDK